MNKFKFGEKVLVSGYLVRKRKQDIRTWEAFSYPTPKEALFLGYRTLSNGVMKYWDNFDGEGGGYFLKATEFFKGACICIEGKKPQNIALTQVEKLQ